MSDLVPMTRDASQHPAPHSADVHPDQVAEWQAAGWSVADGSAPPRVEALAEGADLSEATDAQLAELHRTAFGKAPRPSLTRDAIIAKLREAN